ncbi:MAG: YebC/PmpR family DNA-binding transcriptional regulator [Patescibacteria group bacterium]
MSGHSKWSTIKRKKGVNDLIRAKTFTKLLFQISNATKSGGDDPKNNYTLKLACDKAREANIPISTIEGVIKKASGEGSNNDTEDVEYEIYLPFDKSDGSGSDGSRSNVEILVDCQTSNKNKLVAEIREVVSRNGGILLSKGSISWNFVPLNLITLKIDSSDNQSKKFKNTISNDKTKIDGKYITDISSFEEELLSIDGVYDYEYDSNSSIDQDVEHQDAGHLDAQFRIYTTQENTNIVRDAILEKGYLIDNIENVKVAKNNGFKSAGSRSKVKIEDLDPDDINVDKIESFIDAIESIDGVINTYLNI